MKRLTYIFFIAILLCSCSSDAYDTGDGALSLMRAEFVEASSNSSSALVSVVTDDGEEMPLTKGVSLSWASRPDTVYRALLYYNKVVADDGTNKAEPLSLSQVPVLAVHDVSDFTGGVITDPVVFESAWKSRNGKYLNLDINLKTGKSGDDNSRHVVGIALAGTGENEAGHKTIRLVFYHSQNGVPEYYSSKLYVSIPVSELPFIPSEGDEVSLGINTYDGIKTVSFKF